MRQYGTINAPPYSSAPAVGLVGDLYYNTSDGLLYMSNGSTWVAVSSGAPTPPGVSVNGWIAAPYPWLPANDNTILIQDNNNPIDPNYGKGTRLWCIQSSINFYGVVVATAAGSTGATLPMTAVSFDTTTDTFTKAANGFANGDCVYLTAASPSIAGASLNTPYFVIAAATNTFQLSASIGGAALNLTGSNGTVTVNGGTVLTLAPNADFGLTRGAALTNPKYSFEMSPPGYPGWFNYTTTQLTSPLTFTGYSVNPTSLAYQYRVDGNMVSLAIRDGANGTSNAGTLNLTVPIRAALIPNAAWVVLCRVVDNGVTQTTPGALALTSNALTATCNKDSAAGVFTTSGGKRIANGLLVYPI